MRHRSIELHQERYRSSCICDGNALDRISAQWTLTYGIDAALRSADPEQIRAEAKQIDLTLTRGALSYLQKALRDVAIHDGAILLRERILDTSDEQRSLTRWLDWLRQGECWPRLADQYWSEIRSEGMDRIVEALAADGVVLNEEAKKAIFVTICAITLKDLIPDDAYNDFFPIEPDEETTEADF